MISRRSFLEASGLIGLVAARGGSEAAGLAPRPQEPLPPLDRPAGPPDRVAGDEAYWGRVAVYYRVSDRYTNLEAGYFGMMAAPVLAAYHRAIDRVNLESSYFARRSYDGELAAARRRLADFLGATPAEVLFTRGATEALQRLIIQYRGVSRGDVVMYADLDYHAMQFAMNALARQRGARVARLAIPEPASREAVLAAYGDALDREPRTRLLLLTHLNNKTGLIIPVKELVALARARGADVVVDAAHSFGQVDLRLDDLGADFVGLNLHKWIGAPVGVGAMYIRNGRLDDIDIMLEDESGDQSQIESRIHTGTANFATFLTVPSALDFHAAVGPAHKAARVRYLRDRWVKAARERRGIDVLTPDDPGLVAAITSFRLKGQTGRAENQAIVANLLDRYGLFTVWRTGLARGDCVRVTPALYNVPAHADRLGAALAELASA
ncbi:MAG: aminotransferase class V-fold PLP-dependent enzyme [Gemmatimonadales bacterium]